MTKRRRIARSWARFAVHQEKNRRTMTEEIKRYETQTERPDRRRWSHREYFKIARNRWTILPLRYHRRFWNRTGQQRQLWRTQAV